MRLFVSLVFCATLCLSTIDATVGAAQRSRRQGKVPRVEKVYVGDMGRDEDAERFRLMLEAQLFKRDFEVVVDAKDADAILTGILTVEVFEYNTDASVTVRLESQAGAVIWAKDFARKRFSLNPIPLPETPQRRAEQVAEAMYKEFKKPKGKQP